MTFLPSKPCEVTLYADDTSLFFSHKKKIEGAKILIAELSKIMQWLAANELCPQMKITFFQQQILVYQQ